MKAIPLDEIVKIINGTIVSGQGNPSINNIEYDPLKVKSGNGTLFFHFNPKRGLHHLRKINAVIVTEKPGTAKNGNIVIKVDHVREAYWSLMSHYRSLFKIPVVGITGTSGKTTTKEMITQVLTLDGMKCSIHLSEL
ncbi:hypothetical protein J7I93_01455 [Bacillus sp. ISL-47]|uniref:Mur ligase family protein n=1 Tax=Bacillus sp. ISL-47 TaxID=2819130 RepID=UPI001BE73C44|nr:Mur ligase family protein [Bacillus sp. ISL-47]MBT2686842.1 hypothetical protein [Bacillus sp. ISL-47]MBT2706805.1 hypothetical protein [Pseudomonas sp. ISL-84]